MEAYVGFMGMNDSVLGLLLLLGAFLVNAAIISIFGNSLGKVIFGLRAAPALEAGDFGFTWVFRREMRVWFFGAAVGLPIIALFTMARDSFETVL